MSKFRSLINMLTDLLYNKTAMEKINDDRIRQLINSTNITDLQALLKLLETSESDSSDPVYRKVNGYVCLAVCVFGTVANILNIAVLTRKDMVCTPVNRILTGLAVADMMVMVEYIPFAYYYYFVLPNKNDYPYPWAVYMLFHTNFAQVLHTISICLTLALAIWRYIAIK